MFTIIPWYHRKHEISQPRKQPRPSHATSSELNPQWWWSLDYIMHCCEKSCIIVSCNFCGVISARVVVVVDVCVVWCSDGRSFVLWLLISRVRAWVAHLSFVKGHLWSPCYRSLTLLFTYANYARNMATSYHLPLRNHLSDADRKWPSAELRWATHTLTRLFFHFVLEHPQGSGAHPLDSTLPSKQALWDQEVHCPIVHSVHRRGVTLSDRFGYVWVI